MIPSPFPGRGSVPARRSPSLSASRFLAAGLGSRAWSAVLAATGLFYGVFGALQLGVYLDAGLIIGSVALAVIALRPPEQDGTLAGT